MTDYRAERDENLIDKIGKLLAKAAGTKNEIERDLFNAKAMQLIEDNNLSMAAIEIGGNSSKAAKRTDEKLAGGLYQWQRDLWEAVAKLNFCMYFNVYTFDKDKVSKYWARKYGGVANVPDNKKGGFKFQHRLVGRVINVESTKVMAQYLEQAIEVALKDNMSEQHLFSEWANGFRVGAADEVILKLVRRRREIERDEKEKELAREAEARKHSAEGYSISRTLTLAGVKEAEEIANYDFMNGDGAWARKLERRAKLAAQVAKEEKRHAEWAAANPEEAMAQEEKRRKEARKYDRTPWNYGTGKSKYDKSGYNTGSLAGSKIGIDQQMSSGAKRKLGHG